MLGFKGAGLLFKDPEEDGLYSLITDDNSYKNPMIKEHVRYPSIGLTGMMFESSNDEQIYVAHNGQKDKRFIMEIDNLSEQVDVDNAIYVKLIIGNIHDKKECVGVL